MITLKNVTKRVLRDDKEVDVLSNINLQLGDKGLVVLRGGKEAGKTCLMRMIAQLDDISDGNIFVDGVDIGQLGHKEIENYRTHYVGMLMGKDDILPDLTIEENVVIGTAFGRIKPKKDVLDMLYSNLGLTNVTKRKAKECTDGEKVCANIARLMIKSPRVILVDDFEDILEADTMLRIWRILKELSETHLVVIVSDSQPYISKFADRVITMNMGKIISDAGSDGRIVDASGQRDIMDKSIFLKKHRFTLGATSKLVKQMFFTNGKSMIRTMAFSLLLIIGFIIFSSLSVFNANYTLAKSSIADQDSYIEFYQGNSVDERYTLNYDNVSGTTVMEDLQKQNLSYFCVKHEVNWKTNVGGDGFTISSLITNSQELIVGDENKFGQKLLSGKYTGSGAIGNDEEHGVNLVISDYMAEVIIKNGIEGGFVANQNATDEFRNQTLYDSLTKSVNQSHNNLTINGVKYKICGIYKTDFDKYVEKDLSVKKANRDIFAYKLKNEYSVVHVNANFYAINSRIVSTLDISGSVFTSYNPNNTFDALLSDATKIRIVNTTNNVNNAKYGYGVADGLKAFDSNSKREDVYVSADIVQKILAKIPRNLTIEEIIEDSKAGATGDYFSNNTLDAYKKLKVSISNVGDLNIKGIIPNPEITNTILVQGTSLSVVNRPKQQKSVFDYMYNSNNFATNGVVMPVSVFNAGEIESVINTMSENKFKVNTLASESILAIGETIDGLRIVFIGFSIGCVLGIILLFLAYIKKLYMKNTKMLGLLRSLGCTKFNISISIMLISIASMGAILILGGLISWLITIIGNAIMAGAYSYAVSIFNINMLFTIVFALIMLATPCLIAPFVCTEFQNLLPLYMLKYDEIFGKKKENKEESNPQNTDNSGQIDEDKFGKIETSSQDNINNQN